MGRIRLARFGERDIGGSLSSARGPRLRKDDSIIYRDYNLLGGGFHFAVIRNACH